MIKATYSDKAFIANLLTESFFNNKSVNYIISSSGNKKRKVLALMNYSFEICHRFGEVFLNDEKTACALILYPDHKTTSLSSVLSDIKLLIYPISLINIPKVMAREKAISSLYPGKDIFYLWYIAVTKNLQHRGVGTKFMMEICSHADKLKRDIYLETSAEENINWYKKIGFTLYNVLNFNYELSCFKKAYQ